MRRARRCAEYTGLVASGLAACCMLMGPEAHAVDCPFGMKYEYPGSINVGDPASAINPTRNITLPGFCIDVEEMRLNDIRYVPPAAGVRALLCNAVASAHQAFRIPPCTRSAV